MSVTIPVRVQTLISSSTQSHFWCCDIAWRMAVTARHDSSSHFMAIQQLSEMCVFHLLLLADSGQQQQRPPERAHVLRLCLCHWAGADPSTPGPPGSTLSTLPQNAPWSVAAQGDCHTSEGCTTQHDWGTGMGSVLLKLGAPMRAWHIFCKALFTVADTSSV